MEIYIMQPIGLYIHIPFCSHKCLYCDFYSAGARIADWPLFTNSLLNELYKRQEEISGEIKTIYFGGGTPSLIPPDHLHTFINKIFNIGKIKINPEEFTLEANPEDITSDNCRRWKDSGVTRLSIGIQSLNDSELINIGRRHSSTDGLMAIKTAKSYFENVSVDIMFGIPGQTLESYKETLHKILDSKPQHISSYSLMLEKGTAMTHLYEKEKIKLPSEDQWMRLFQSTTEILRNGGFRRYEISNYALPGYESKHNSLYWKGNAYIGLGPGAHSYDGRNVRKANPWDLKGYIKHFTGEDLDICFYETELLSETELKEEMIMTRLRLAEGLSLCEFSLRFGKEKEEILKKKSKRFIEQGLLSLEKNNIRMTERGMEVSDLIISSLF